MNQWSTCAWSLTWSHVLFYCQATNNGMSQVKVGVHLQLGHLVSQVQKGLRIHCGGGYFRQISQLIWRTNNSNHWINWISKCGEKRFLPCRWSWRSSRSSKQGKHSCWICPNAAADRRPTSVEALESRPRKQLSSALLQPPKINPTILNWILNKKPIRKLFRCVKWPRRAPCSRCRSYCSWLFATSCPTCAWLRRANMPDMHIGGKQA